MSLADWSVILIFFSVLGIVAFTAKRYTRSAADFLAANRCAGRYLLTMADGMASVGAIAVIGYWQTYYQAGFAAQWWLWMFAPVSLLLTLSGFIIYRYRETQALTLAQFFEMRYSRRFRVFSGMLAWFAGVLNYGIFPAVTGTFLIYFCGLPVYTYHLGPVELNVTLGIVMAIELSIALVFTFMGGLISVMIADFLQAQFVNIAFLAIMIILFWKIGWFNIIDTLKQAPAGKSMLNPFKQGKIPDFNVWYFVMLLFLQTYGYMAWQGAQGFNCAAKSPHEARMSKILAVWRWGVTQLMLVLIPVCAYVVLHNTLFQREASVAQAAIDGVSAHYVQVQVAVPLAIKQILPVGVLGLLCAVMISGAVATDDVYLHSWGSIFIQDVVMPLRKMHLSSEQHVKWLRRSIFAVAAFGWIFSMLFPLSDFIQMYLQITGAIYLGGAGAVIIGGLYWKRATIAGAWAGMITGCTLSVFGIVLQSIIWPYIIPALKQSHASTAWLQKLPAEFPVNGMKMGTISACIAILAYVIVSLLSRPQPGFDMDRMLHRGKHAGDSQARAGKSWDWKTQFKELLGFGAEFTRSDKLICIVNIVWYGFWFVAFVIGTAYNFAFDVSDDAWAKWWFFSAAVTIVIGVFTIVWFLWGGARDLAEMFRRLRSIKRNEFDDGSVTHQRDAVEESALQKK